MRIYFAPLEGLTNTAYREAHAACFGGADLYFTPFYSPSAEGLSKKEQRDLVADGMPHRDTVPQLLCRRTVYFMTATAQLVDMGYTALNLNLGCPSGTVTSKHKGSGFLTIPDELDRFFDEVFNALAQEHPAVTLSVKTRIGYEREEEMERLLTIYNRYPIAELIVHPRLRSDLYRGTPRMETFAYVAENSRAPVCYNGDIFSLEDYRAFTKKFPNISRVMIGRGAIATPALPLECRGVTLDDKKERLRAMHDRILESNLRVMGEGRNLICRMADIWNYMIFQFTDDLRAARPLHHVSTLAEYRAAAAAIFRSYPIRPDARFIPPQKR